MAFLLGCEKVRVEFPTKEVFDEVSLGVNVGDRIGIVGRNGDGKSTLLNLLAGKLEPDEGRVLRNGFVRVGILGQTDELDPHATVEHAMIGNRPVYEWAGDVHIRDIIAGLVGDIPWEAQVETLSGGQRRRVDLARLLIDDWDVLALDEPTNHLDIRAITWLANHLKNRWKQRAGALLVVTHDRWFLDEVCTSMWEVHHKGVEPFEGGFSAYLMQRVERERRAALAEQKRQNALRRELAWLSRGARARATKPKFHVAAAQELIADVPPLRDDLELKRMAMARLGKQVVELEGVTVRFEEKTVLDNIDWAIGPGDRYGIVGVNGVGKTTLLRVVCGMQKPDAGLVRIGKTVRFAVLSQHLDDLSQWGSDRVWEVASRYSHRRMLDGKDTTPSQLLEKLGFTRADMNEPVKDLSGGQKRRLALMLILLDEPNVLILDEPGNDLDTDMLAAVEDLLDGWPGTLLLVTHDRYLMERVSDHQFAIIDGKLRHLPGGVEEYLKIINASDDVSSQEGTRNVGVSGSKATPNVSRSRSASNSDAYASGSKATPNVSRSRSASNSDAHAPGSKATPNVSDSLLTGNADDAPKLSGGEIRTLRKLMASNERKIETLRGKIEATQAEMAQIDPVDYAALLECQTKLDNLTTQINELEEAWLEAAEKLGE